MSDQSNEPMASGEDARPDRRAWIVVGVLVVVVVLLGVWLLAAGGDDTEDVAGTGGGSTTTSEAGSTTSGTDPPVGSDTTEDIPVDEDPGGITVPEGASTAPVSVPAPAIDQTGITAVRTARHEGFDRVVFEFDGALPGYEVLYAEKPVTEDGSGEEVAVEGPFVVTVRMTPAGSVRFTEDGYEETCTGPDRVPGAGSTVTEVVQTGDFEGQATWAVGLADRVDFAVSTLESPARLVVDFVNH
ncbi:MAG: hypothetical protein M5U19_17365 [Microthrixaceae bacterium]|nr:hypothetical protein [Microthrixaceae bacterium]